MSEFGRDRKGQFRVKSTMENEHGYGKEGSVVAGDDDRSAEGEVGEVSDGAGDGREPSGGAGWMGSGPEPAEFQEGAREARRVIVGSPEEFASLRSHKGQAMTNNPKGKPRGTRVSKWSENKLRALLDNLLDDLLGIRTHVIQQGT